MRTALAISDDILRELRALSRQRGISLTKTANWILRTGLAHLDDEPRRNRSYAELVVDLGEPTMNLDRALGVAAEIEDQMVLHKLEQNKGESSI